MKTPGLRSALAKMITVKNLFKKGLSVIIFFHEMDEDEYDGRFIPR